MSVYYYDLYISGAGPEYNPGIGFQNRYDYHVHGGFLNYSWLSPEFSGILKHGPQLTLFDWYSQSRGIREGFDAGLFYRLSTKKAWTFGAGIDHHYEYVFESFDLSDDAWVPADEYSYTNLSGYLSTPMTRSQGISFKVQGGQYYDGNIISLSASPRWSISSSLVLSGTYMYNQIDFVERDQYFVSHIGRLKAQLMFTTSLSASAFIQYNSSVHNIISNFRFRYNPREGNDFWLVYNEGTNTDLRREIPYRPSLAGRTVMLKYTYTFRL